MTYDPQNPLFLGTSHSKSAEVVEKLGVLMEAQRIELAQLMARYKTVESEIAALRSRVELLARHHKELLDSLTDDGR